MRSIDLPISRIAAIAAAAVLLSGVTALAFAAWIGSGPAIFMAMVDAGLSWCF